MPRYLANALSGFKANLLYIVRRDFICKIKAFSQVEKILKKETVEVRLDLQDILEKLEFGLKLGWPHVKPLTNIHSNLYEIRVKDKKGQFRVIYFLKKRDSIYLIHAFRKKTQKLTLKEKTVILQRLKEIA